MVVGGQTGVHPRLAEASDRHLQRPYRLPLPGHSVAAFRSVQSVLPAGKAKILDSGCGTGCSTVYLAGMYPRSVVIGVDRSRKRLRMRGADRLRKVAENAWLVRAELGAFWMLACHAGWILHSHFLLYPNPYPKAVQFKRRWTSHPAFPYLLALGGRVELRSNWDVYTAEMAAAVSHASGKSVKLCRYQPHEPWTAFEAKYLNRGQPLYACRFGSQGRWWQNRYCLAIQDAPAR